MKDGVQFCQIVAVLKIFFRSFTIFRPLLFGREPKLRIPDQIDAVEDVYKTAREAAISIE